MRAFIAATVSLLPGFGLLAAGACQPETQVPSPVAASAAEYVSTGWEACDQKSTGNPDPRDADPARTAELLHGVWTGSRAVRDGKSLYPNLVQGNEPNANYVLIFDMSTRQGIAFEERGPDIAVNAFARLLPASTGAPDITYFYCGGPQFSAFRDRFTKVSGNPQDGLRALARVTGQPVGEGSVADAWARLRDSGFLTSDRGTAVITASMYQISTGAVRDASGRTDVRWDMQGEYRGSPAKFTAGQPAGGLEGGVFQRVGAGEASFLVASPMDVPCFGLAVMDPKDPAAHVQPSSGQTNTQTELRYTKVVIGPFR
jgi:hypothetical protein